MKKLRPLLAVVSSLALAGPLASSAIAEETLGRLFFSPERRQALDHQRQFNIHEKQEIAEDPTITIDGVVTRSSGRRTVWLNGVVEEDSGTSGNASGIEIITDRNSPESVVVKSSDAMSNQVRVGDTINRNTGAVADLLEGGSIRKKTPGRRNQ